MSIRTNHVFSYRMCSRFFNTVRESISDLYDGVKVHVTNACLAVKNFVVANPRLVIATVVLTLAILLATPIATIVLNILGFGPGGIQVASFAAWFQSTFYGGSVPAGSLFSFCQSFAAVL